MSKDSEKILLNTVSGLMRPIVRICVRKSIKLKEIIDLLKEVFVEVAVEELDRQKEELSMSKISVMTGVHRKDVTRIQRDNLPQDKPQNLIAKIMTQWRQKKEYRTKAGKPRVLSCEGRQSEFARLVESINGKNVSAYTVLFEMERMGVIVKRGNTVKLKWQDYVTEDVEEGLEMLVEDSSDMITAVEENIFTPNEIRNLHLKTEYDCIPLRSAKEVRQWILEEGSKFHKKVSSFLSDIEDSSMTNEPQIRVALGTFGVVNDAEQNLDFSNCN